MYSKFVHGLKTKPLQFLFIVFSILVLKEVIYIQTFRNDVSPIADGFSEANTIRGGVFFHQEGLTKYKGLPNILYGDLLPSKGSAGYQVQGIDKNQAYTHYPPGPEYMAWLGFSLFGIGNFNALRFLPILLSVFVGVLFIKQNFQLVGGGIKGLIFGLMLILPPMYSNYMHGLHHQQYAFLMLQLQMSLAILYFTTNSNRLLLVLGFAVLGFFQGWMTFDYAFLATLFVIPFYFYFNAPFRSLVLIGLASGFSYTLAHILHFFQVVSYYGDTQRAINDFIGSAAHRAHNAANEIDKPLEKYDANKIGTFTVAKDFLWRVAGRGKYLAINLINFIWVIIGLKFIKRVTLKKGYSFEFNISGKDLMALLFAVIISCLWSIVMKQHAHIHGFIARHYFLCYYFCCLILISKTTKVD